MCIRDRYIKLFSLTIINMFIFYLGNAVLEAEKQFFPGKIVGVIRRDVYKRQGHRRWRDHRLGAVQADRSQQAGKAAHRGYLRKRCI